MTGTQPHLVSLSLHMRDYANQVIAAPPQQVSWLLDETKKHVFMLSVQRARHKNRVIPGFFRSYLRSKKDRALPSNKQRENPSWLKIAMSDQKWLKTTCFECIFFDICLQWDMWWETGQLNKSGTNYIRPVLVWERTTTKSCCITIWDSATGFPTLHLKLLGLVWETLLRWFLGDEKIIHSSWWFLTGVEEF